MYRRRWYPPFPNHSPTLFLRFLPRANWFTIQRCAQRIEIYMKSTRKINKALNIVDQQVSSHDSSNPSLPSGTLESGSQIQGGWRLLYFFSIIIFPCIFGWLSVEFVRLEKGAIYLSDFATYWSQVVSITNEVRVRGITWPLITT